jgi:hypothetical protein
MRRISVGIALWITSVLAAPAFANWFDGSSLYLAAGHKLLVGSASSPTPNDLCAIGESNSNRCYTDATRKVRKEYVLKYGHYQEDRPGLDDKSVENQTPKPAEIR